MTANQKSLSSPSARLVGRVRGHVRRARSHLAPWRPGSTRRSLVPSRGRPEGWKGRDIDRACRASPQRSGCRERGPKARSHRRPRGQKVERAFPNSVLKGREHETARIAPCFGRTRVRCYNRHEEHGAQKSHLHRAASRASPARMRRRNAVDKVIGTALLADELPLPGRVLMVNGRSSFEIVQKVLIARIPIVAGVSAASSLGVELAQSCGMALVGFVRDRRSTSTREATASHSRSSAFPKAAAEQEHAHHRKRCLCDRDGDEDTSRAEPHQRRQVVSERDLHDPIAKRLIHVGVVVSRGQASLSPSSKCR